MDGLKHDMNDEKEKEEELVPEVEVAESAEDIEQQEPDEAEPVSREEELETKLIELKDQLLRTVADSDNYRKRAEREREQTRKFGIANFAKELLSIADNLGRALEAAPKDDDTNGESMKNLILGIQMTEQELQKAFENNNIRKIDPLGEKFDYNFHQVMFEVEETKEEPGVVVQVLQPGYAIEDRILRPAMVGVSKSGEDDKTQRVDTTA